jgi:hypothetical protein
MIHTHWLRLCWASGCESWCAMLSQWLWIMVCYAEPVVMYHGVWCWASGCVSWCVMLSQWLWIVVCYFEWFSIAHHDSQPLVHSSLTMIHNHLLSLTHHDSQPLAQHTTSELCWTSGCESWCAMMSQCLWIVMSYGEPVVVNNGVFVNCDELWWASCCE